MEQEYIAMAIERCLYRCETQQDVYTVRDVAREITKILRPNKRVAFWVSCGFDRETLSD